MFTLVKMLAPATVPFGTTVNFASSAFVVVVFIVASSRTRLFLTSDQCPIIPDLVSFDELITRSIPPHDSRIALPDDYGFLSDDDWLWCIVVDGSCVALEIVRIPQMWAVNLSNFTVFPNMVGGRRGNSHKVALIPNLFRDGGTLDFTFALALDHSVLQLSARLFDFSLLGDDTVLDIASWFSGHLTFDFALNAVFFDLARGRRVVLPYDQFSFFNDACIIGVVSVRYAIPPDGSVGSAPTVPLPLPLAFFVNDGHGAREQGGESDGGLEERRRASSAAEFRLCRCRSRKRDDDDGMDQQTGGQRVMRWLRGLGHSGCGGLAQASAS